MKKFYWKITYRDGSVLDDKRVNDVYYSDNVIELKTDDESVNDEMADDVLYIIPIDVIKSIALIENMEPEKF